MQNGKEEQGSQNSQPFIVRSCQSNLGEDPIQSSSHQYQQIPKPRSFKGFDDQNQWDQLSSAQRKQQKQAIAKQLGKNQVKKKQISKLPKNFANNKRFTDQIIDSEDVEMSELDSSQQKNGKQQKNIEMANQIKKKKQYFNVILIGAASTGKTTYMQCLLKQYKQKSQQKVIKQHTQQIVEVLSPTMSSNLSLQFRVIDTPGFNHSSIDSYSKLIQKEIKDRIQRTKHNRKSALTQSSVYQKQERQVRDQRIHCCLFFFRGPRMHSDDWRMMEQLHDKCNIIPVIAKGDCYTIKQIEQLKRNIKQKAKQKNIKWFDIEQYIRQKHPKQLKNIEDGPYGRSPPFVIVSSTTKIQKDADIRVGRQFKWGTCIIEDDEHTQFNTLNKILTTYLAQGFVKMIDVMEDTQRAKIEQKNTIWKKARKISIGVLAIGIITAITFTVAKNQRIKN